MNTRKITVSGLVQGIGFRPFVAELAEELGLRGQVKNLGGVVEIIIHGNLEAVDSFIHRLLLVSENGALPGCRLDDFRVDEMPDGGALEGCVQEWTRFSIVPSGDGREVRRFLPVDLPTCDRCVAEMHDPKNRRYRYPFISCTACGPRFSIQRAVPYDRETITMDDFAMCEDCRKEYTQKGNIRRHAQTIACKNCGPELVYVGYQDAKGDKEIATIVRITDEQEAIRQAVADLLAGKIGAIKDIGGYHFAFSPMNSEAANRLRAFKNRDRKPFAVMFPDVKSIREYAYVSEEEEALLLSSARPIVLLNKKKDFVPEVCGESDRIGALLPCNPLQILLLEETGPLVMTSGNRGGEPIIIKDDEMMSYLGENGISFILNHNREILGPLDDSIYQVNVFGNRKVVQLIRRARGLAPEPIALGRELSEDWFAAGGDLKASFALGRGNLVYLSQYFGDLDDVRCTEARKRGKQRMERLLDIQPTNRVTDLHPGYVSVIEVMRDATESASVLQVQHHHAHVASVIAEHGLKGNVLGIACDGTGYGTDGTIWGSELLLCKNELFERAGCFSPVKLLGADTSAKDADLTLLCFVLEAQARGIAAGIEETSIAESAALRRMAWEQNINTAVSSSMGRLFDAAAALLDICHYNSYEGECAIRLEQMAHAGYAYICDHSVEDSHFAHILEGKRSDILYMKCRKTDGIWQADGVQLLVDLFRLKNTYSKEILAYLFHHAVATGLVELADAICREKKQKLTVALSGGTFINRILLKEVMEGLEELGYPVYTNEKVPCGDGGIALGQMYLASFAERKCAESEEGRTKIEVEDRT